MPIKKSARQFRIHGMDCAEEVAILKREVGPVVGSVEWLSFDILNGKMIVLPDASAIPSQQIVHAVSRTGMRAEIWADPVPGSANHSFWERRSRTLLTSGSGVLLVTALASNVWFSGGFVPALGSEGIGLAHQVPGFSRTLFALSTLCGAWFVLPKAWFSVRRMRPDMNLLMTLAIVGAIEIGEWFEAATVAFLFALSLTLESWSIGRARRAVESLMAIAPPLVRILHDDNRTEEIAPDRVPVGSRFLVRPGERIALDGIILQGASEINQAPITGESLPISKEPGEQVFAGTINGSGALEIQTTKLAGQTTLANITRMVGEAQSRRAPSEQWVDRFAQIYTPAVLLIAVVTACIPPLLFGGLWTSWLCRALVLLVIGCPCALVISTPVSIVASLAAAARNGILVKGGIYMEMPARLRAIALDKTGTVTMGKPDVVQVVPMNGHSSTELLERVGALETHSDHPLARAIMSYIQRSGVSITPATEFQILNGRGATANSRDRSYWLGSHRYLEERRLETPEIHAELERLSQSGHSVVVVGNEIHVCGFVALADTLRPHVREIISQLRRAGIGHIVMLTGDNAGTAQIIAQQAGIEEVKAELLPEDKVNAVESLVQEFGKVAMVGDGINDAPAMGRASLAIAMGAAGSDTAIEAADIALMSDDLSKLPWLVKHSRRTIAVIQQNITLSLLMKAIFVTLTMLGHASLWAAIAADTGVSLAVIANALRLLQGNSTSARGPSKI